MGETRVTLVLTSDSGEITLIAQTNSQVQVDVNPPAAQKALSFGTQAKLKVFAVKAAKRARKKRRSQCFFGSAQSSDSSLETLPDSQPERSTCGHPPAHTRETRLK